MIEALTVLFVFSIITTTFYSVFSLGTNYIIESKNRLGAVSLANEKMEIVRNLKYDDIGITGGIPSGNIPNEEDVVENKHQYHIRTLVQYVDDSFDGIFPSDLIPNDYKRVKIVVSWKGLNGSESDVFLVGRFVPPGMEQGISGGILSINIIGSDGIGVPQASVHITNSSISPAIDMIVMTDDSGNIMLPGAKQSIEEYYFEVSKNDYETVETINPDSVEYTPIDVPASVVDGMLNVKSIIQNKTIDLKIMTIDEVGSALPNISFNLSGGRILGNDMLASPIAPIYNMSSNYTTNANGEKTLENISPGQFSISNIDIPSGYTFVGFDAGSNPVVVAPGENEEIKIRLANNSENGALIKITDSADGSSIVGATVIMSNGNGYNENMTTLADGVAYFPRATTLEAGEYNVEISAGGYGTHNGLINIDGLIEQQVSLIAN